MKEIVLTTNGKLSPKTLETLSKMLCEKFSCENIRHETSDGIIGGICVKYDGTFYDMSVSENLSRLKKYVMNAEAENGND